MQNYLQQQKIEEAWKYLVCKDLQMEGQNFIVYLTTDIHKSI